MGLFKRRAVVTPLPTYEPDRVDKDAVYNEEVRVSAGDGGLPGTCGFVGAGPLPRNAMPNTRLMYVRPDGQEGDHTHWRGRLRESRLF